MIAIPIAIPNMKKPKDCEECYISKYIPCNTDYRDCPLIEIVPCGECIWKEECTITELWGGRGFCPSGERRTDEGITE